ncbi:MAG: CRISPR-associated endonuclease Cas2 [Gudongella sp.]|nr:CRISPR-associated endonuclease Cas2 [Gudongella sp.]
MTYDVDTGDVDGRRRLRHVAKICINYGIRVQKSVFECRLAPAQRVTLEKELIDAIDVEKDSLRLYNLGNNPSKIMHIGAHKPIDLDDTLMF